MWKSALTVPSSDFASVRSESVESGTVGGEPLAQRRRQVGHLLIGARAARDPLPDLGGAVGGLAGIGERLLEQGAVHAASVRTLGGAVERVDSLLG